MTGSPGIAEASKPLSPIPTMITRASSNQYGNHENKRTNRRTTLSPSTSGIGSGTDAFYSIINNAGANTPTTVSMVMASSSPGRRAMAGRGRR